MIKVRQTIGVIDFEISKSIGENYFMVEIWDDKGFLTRFELSAEKVKEIIKYLKDNYE